MSTRDNYSANQNLIRYLVLPTMFLTVALLGGVRVAATSYRLIFVPPPLITLILALLLMFLFVRGNLIVFRSWLSAEQLMLTNASHLLTLTSVFFASAQAFSSVLPEQRLFYGLFSFFFLWTLWNNQFADFDPRRLLRSLAVLFATAFALKHLLLASLYDSDGGFLKQLAGMLLEGISLGTIERQSFAPATGYISFFTLVIYVAGLALLPARIEPTEAASSSAPQLLREYQNLPAIERAAVRQAVVEHEARPSETYILEEHVADSALESENLESGTRTK